MTLTFERVSGGSTNPSHRRSEPPSITRSHGMSVLDTSITVHVVGSEHSNFSGDEKR